jgi:hypothetical protein
MMTRHTIEEVEAMNLPDIIVGESYEFYAEMVQEQEPPDKRMRNYTGQQVKVLCVNEDSDWFEPYEDDDGETVYPEVSKSFIVKADDGFEFIAMEEELSGWDKHLGQFYGPSGIYGEES